MNKPNQEKTVQQKRIDILIRLSLILVIVTILFFFVVKPMLKRDYYFEVGENYTFENLGSQTGRDSFDVAVEGEGIDAVASALGSAGVGAKTLLIYPLSDLGQSIKNTLNTDWSEDFTPTGNSVSSDFFKGLRYKAGEGSNLDNYISEIIKMTSEQKNLTILFDSKVAGVMKQNGKISGLTVKTPEETRNIQAERYIDASGSGEVLKGAGVAFTKGYGDIGIEDLYPPVKLNFTVSGVDNTQIQKLLKEQGTMINLLLKSYKTGDRDIGISGLSVSDQGNGSVIIEAVTVTNVDLNDERAVKTTYDRAKKECEDFYSFLKVNLKEFSEGNISVAPEFVMSAPNHFKGRYHMTLSDVLTGKRYTDRISTASRPVTLVMKDGNRYLLCNPKTFYIPLGSLIPEGVDNVLMTGDKISASPLVQTAINSNASKAGTGYAAGIIAAYSISKDMDIPMLIEDRNLDTQQEIEKILRKSGIYMSDIKEDITSITGDWSYPYAEKLINLGLLSGGVTNDFKYDREAKNKDMAFILLNGVPRVSEEAYNYKFDISVRKYLNEEQLTKDSFGEIVLSIFHKDGVTGNYYTEACKLGLIDENLQGRLKNRSVLKLSEVYYASVKLMEKLTGQALK